MSSQTTKGLKPSKDPCDPCCVGSIRSPLGESRLQDGGFPPLSQPELSREH